MVIVIIVVTTAVEAIAIQDSTLFIISFLLVIMFLMSLLPVIAITLFLSFIPDICNATMYLLLLDAIAISHLYCLHYAFFLALLLVSFTILATLSVFVIIGILFVLFVLIVFIVYLCICLLYSFVSTTFVLLI